MTTKNFGLTMGILLISLGCSSGAYATALSNQTTAVPASGKDSALRQGTENWEQPQDSFFVIPGIILGLAALVLFYKRD
jgi:hypothetical protein